MPHLPSEFEAQMQHLLGDTYPAFAEALGTPAPVSIRINPRKPGFDTAGLDPVPWCAEGFYLPNRPLFTLDPLFQAGAYYVQEASSMLLAEALQQTVGQRHTYAGQPPLRALDLCAAPGGKSTLMASLLPPDSLLVCNEVIRTRVPVLRENIEKWGYANVAVTNHDPDDFAPLAGFFDIVMVDAPCSGEGLFRKDPKAVGEWSSEHVQLCSARQKRILSAAAPLVAERGWLIYSTCTYNDAENLDNVRFLTQNGFENVPMNVPESYGESWGMVVRETEGSVGYQCFPHRVRGEGFFISMFRKKSNVPPHPRPTRRTALSPIGRGVQARGFKSAKPVHQKQLGALRTYLREPDAFSYWQKPNDEIVAVPLSLEKDLVLLDSVLKNKGFGITMGTFKGTDFLPDHALALSTELSPNVPGLDLSRDDALRFFKKENLSLPHVPKGWLLARYEGLGLGWVKGLGNRVNNYLPNHWRIRMDIPEF
jgi:16S rRNA C967 or C1407 C5-methylase (RsmB/RsmF family)/NOL1/NOP2/fmu family ribosome biogenesis protein